jgi:hypothetical protein
LDVVQSTQSVQPHYGPWNLGSTQPQTDMSTRNLPGGKGRPACESGNLNRHLCASCQENVGSSTSHNPRGFHGLPYLCMVYTTSIDWVQVSGIVSEDGDRIQNRKRVQTKAERWIATDKSITPEMCRRTMFQEAPHCDSDASSQNVCSNRCDMSQSSQLAWEPSPLQNGTDEASRQGSGNVQFITCGRSGI